MATTRVNGAEKLVREFDDEQPVLIEPDGSLTADDGGDSIPLVEPETINLETDDREQPRKGRGRPRGSKSSSSKSAKQEAADLTSLLLGLHDMLALMCKAEEFQINEDEAEKLSKAVNRVNRLYNNYVIPEKLAAWFGLGMAGIGVYGPRLAAYKLRIENEKKNKGPQTIDAEFRPIM